MKDRLFKIENRRPPNGYFPRKLSPEAEICVMRCPTPDKQCKGTCEFFKEEMRKQKQKSLKKQALRRGENKRGINTPDKD